MRQRWFEKLLGPEREDVPTSNHTSYLRRLSPLEETYTKERAVEVCMATLNAIGLNMDEMPGIRLDLDDRPQKSPRACVIASDPPNVVHLITRAQGGLHDYQAFLHEAGHALHYASVDPALPYTFRKISRDHALTEIYSYIVEAISREPAWHAEHFGLSDEQAAENADATVFLEALLFRRYAAKLRFELDFWGRYAEDGGTPGGYSKLLTEATGIRYPAENYLSDMDSGLLLGRLPACLDPLRAAAPLPRPARSARTGGAGPRPVRGCSSSGARGRARRARRSPRASATSRSTRRRCCTSSAPEKRPTRVLTRSPRSRTLDLNRVSGLVGSVHSFSSRRSGRCRQGTGVASRHSRR